MWRMISASRPLTFKHFHLHKLKAMVAALTGEYLTTQLLPSEEAGTLTTGSDASRDLSKECMERGCSRKPFRKPTKHSVWTVTFTGNITLV